jgi:hypothetical protein
MLNELKRHRDIGSKEDLMFFLKEVIGKKKVRLNDIHTMCMYAHGHHLLNPKALIDFCSFTNLIKIETEQNECYLDSGIKMILDNENEMINYIIEQTLNVLFENDIFKTEQFTYSPLLNLFIFNNHYLHLDFAAIRNTLISCGFFEIVRNQSTRIFVVHEKYEKNLATYINKQKRKMSLENLHKQLQHNEKIGDIAEKFVLEYEKRRIDDTKKGLLIKRISEIDVGAGYDIVSFDNVMSIVHDRFIEVKAVSKDEGFFWSRNEMDTAQLKKDNYYLYLVDLNKIGCVDYAPIIINNPIKNLLNSDEWFIETQSFFVKKI